MNKIAINRIWPGCDFCKKELNDYPFITAIGEYGDSVKSHTPRYCPLCGRPLTPEAWEEMKKKLERCMENDLPLQYYPAYRKALRDLKTAIEMVGDNFKRYGMNNWKGMVKVIDVVLKDPEKLMYTASLKGYDIPEPYLSKWRKWQQKKKLEILKDGKSD